MRGGGHPGGIGLDDGRHGGGGGFVARLLLLGRKAIVHLAHDRARPLGRALVLRARGDLLELGAVGDALDGGERRILELAVEGDAEQLGVILHALERGVPHVFLRRVPRDRAERVAVGDARQRGERGRLARGVLRDADERLRILDRRHGGVAVALAQPLEGLERDVAQHRHGLRAHLLVAVGPGHGGERDRVHQLGDGGAPDAGIGVFARHFAEQIALVHRDLLHELQANRGVGVLVTGVGTESIKQCHVRSSLTALSARQLVRWVNFATTSLPWDAALTLVSMSRMRPSAPM